MAFMVRLWQVDDQRHPTWRASVQDPHTGERRGFADLKALFEFLEEQTAASQKVKNTEEDLHGHSRSHLF